MKDPLDHMPRDLRDHLESTWKDRIYLERTMRAASIAGTDSVYRGEIERAIRIELGQRAATGRLTVLRAYEPSWAVRPPLTEEAGGGQPDEYLFDPDQEVPEDAVLVCRMGVWCVPTLIDSPSNHRAYRHLYPAPPGEQRAEHVLGHAPQPAARA